ncbi:MAG TPA: pilin [Steroidobacteraceae bacterium]|nr:pilin [Steroidobacteraceae bacterium]
MLAAFLRDQRFGDSAARLARREFLGFLTYLGGVLGVLAVVSGVFSIFVLPSFGELYTGMGAGPPGLTALVFGSGSYLLKLLILLAAATAVFFGWFALRLGRELRRLQPLPRFLVPRAAGRPRGGRPGAPALAVGRDMAPINVTFGNFVNKHLEGHVVTLQPIVVKGSPASPMSWRCGYRGVPNGMEAVGDNRTDVDPSFLPSSCRT